MKERFQFSLIGVLVLCILSINMGCTSDSTSTGPGSTGPTYKVTATVVNPQGFPQGGATLTLLSPPSDDPKFTAITDSLGKGSIQSPAGEQTLLAKIGTVFQATLKVTVAASDTPTVVTTPLHLVQNTSLGKILIVQASAEQLEDVLRVLGYSTYDSISVNAIRDSAATDSTKLLNWLKQYKLVFSDCNGGDEYGYPVLARVYGRFVASGGKVYGGHYNYYNLQYIWPPYFTKYDNQGSTATDTMKILDVNLQNVVGVYLDWTNSGDSRHLSAYEKFSDLPPSPASYVFGVIKSTSPAVGVIVECHPNPNPNGGKYLWTNYHNQDIKTLAALRKIIEYFMLNM